MPNRDWILRIEDILAAIDEIGQFIKGMTYVSFITDMKTLKAVLYSIAVIGEAARLVPIDVKV